MILEVGFDELPADPGDVCAKCKELIFGIKYCAYCRIGDVQETTYIAELCEDCYLTE